MYGGDAVYAEDVFGFAPREYAQRRDRQAMNNICCRTVHMGVREETSC